MCYSVFMLIPLYPQLSFLSLLGYADYKFGFHKEEARVSGSRNPYFKEIIERLDRVEKKLEKIKK